MERPTPPTRFYRAPTSRVFLRYNRLPPTHKAGRCWTSPLPARLAVDSSKLRELSPKSVAAFAGFAPGGENSPKTVALGTPESRKDELRESHSGNLGLVSTLRSTATEDG